MRTIPGQKWNPKPDSIKNLAILRAILSGKTRFNEVWKEVKGSKAALKLYLEKMQQQGLIVRVKKSHKNVHYLPAVNIEGEIHDRAINAYLKELKRESARYKLIATILGIEQEWLQDCRETSFETVVKHARIMIDLRKKFGLETQEREVHVQKLLHQLHELETAGPTDVIERARWLLNMEKKRRKLSKQWKQQHPNG